ncbi:MAG: D-alanyl-D-alanine carboxypeptidase family protein [Ruminococcaceae bacterium]|nr:D-alanyl-D-alanine carboxypeptidase family protein [Oscillospiraceae bacterium]
MNKNKNLRPLLFWTLVGITLVSAILFAIAKISSNRPVPVPITEDTPISKLEYWDDENGTVAKDIVYEKDQSIYTSSFIGEYKNFSINPKVAKISKNGWNLILLNKNNILPDNYEITLAEIAGGQIKMDADAATFFNKMYIDASREGIILTPFSGYRTISFQRKLFENKISEIMKADGLEEKDAALVAVKSINVPATSEHNAGLAVDIISRDVSFAETEEYQWLCANAHKYGFILRYPEDKKNITGVEFKPYHWRFVGINAANEMKNSGQCLEEYVK